MDRSEEDRAWNEACAEADRLDPGWRWDDLQKRRPMLPPEKDAIQIIQQAWIGDVTVEFWPSWPSVMGKLVGRGELSARWIFRDFESHLDNYQGNRRFDKDLRAVLLEACRESAELAADPVGLEESDPGFHAWVVRPFLAKPRNFSVEVPSRLSKVLRYRALIDVDNGYEEGAVRSVRRILVAARAAAEPPLLITGLLAFACRALAVRTMERILGRFESDIAHLTVLQQSFEAALTTPLLMNSFLGERAAIEDLVQALEKGTQNRKELRDLDRGSETRFTRIRAIDLWIHRRLGRATRKSSTLPQFRFQSDIIKFLKTSPDAIARNSIAFEESLRRFRLEEPRGVASMLKVFDADRRQRAMLGTMVAGLAAERFRIENGNWPSSLGDLVPKYLAAIPTDLFDLKPIRYCRVDDHVRIYSVGHDGEDGGGEQLWPSPPGTVGDLGIKLWDPSSRGLPAVEA